MSTCRFFRMYVFHMLLFQFYSPLSNVVVTHSKTKFTTYTIRYAKRKNEVGNHFIWDYQRGENLNVPTNVGFLHHYRDVDRDVCGDDCVNAPNQVDRTAHKYRDMLLENVKKVVLKLSDQCKLDY